MINNLKTNKFTSVLFILNVYRFNKIRVNRKCVFVFAVTGCLHTRQFKTFKVYILVNVMFICSVTMSRVTLLYLMN